MSPLCSRSWMTPAEVCSLLPGLFDFLVLCPNFRTILFLLQNWPFLGELIISPRAHPFPSFLTLLHWPLSFHFYHWKQCSERCAGRLVESKSVLTVCVIGNMEHLTENETEVNFQETEWEWMRACSDNILESSEKWLCWKFATVSIQVSTKFLTIQMKGILDAISLNWQN